MFNPISRSYLYYIQLKQYKLHVKCCSDFAFIAGTYSQELIKQGIRKEKEGKLPNTSWDLIREMNRLNSLIGEAQWGSQITNEGFDISIISWGCQGLLVKYSTRSVLFGRLLTISIKCCFHKLLQFVMFILKLYNFTAEDSIKFNAMWTS